MTIEEKLERFQAVCSEDARKRFDEIIGDYQKGLETAFEAHKEDAKRRQEMRAQIETEKIEKEIRRILSSDQIRIRREQSKKEEELKEKLFDEVETVLNEFRKTKEYREMLIAEIEKVRETAGEAACEIYVDRGDEALIPSLPAGVSVSDTPFCGGIIAVIPEKNMLIDNSFRTRAENEKHAFSFAE